MSKGKSEMKFIFYSTAIFFFYFVFALLQEKITRGKYGQNDKFTCALSLVFVQCVVNYIFAQILMLSWKHEKDTTRRLYYFSSALTYFLAMVCSIMALQWVNYPTQVVGKAAKPIPVMILGVLIGRKAYPLKKYLFIFLIVIGVALFMFKDQIKKAPGIPDDGQAFGIGEVLLLMSLTMDGLTGAVQYLWAIDQPLYLFTSSVVSMAFFIYKDQMKKAPGIPDEGQAFGIGEVLLLMSLTMDGLTGAVQERIKTESSPTAYSMMLNTNWWSMILSGVGVLVSGEIFKFITFVTLYPEIVVYLISFALTGALGQLFIFFMVSEFGPLPCSVVTTTRKFFTVLASVIFFGNVLATRQWIGAVLVFTGLFLDIFYSKGQPAPKRAAQK